MKKKSNAGSILSLLDSVPVSSDEVGQDTEELIIGLINGMKQHKMLENQQERNIIEVIIQTGTYLCELNKEGELIQLYRVSKS